MKNNLFKTALACLVIVGWLLHAAPAYADSAQGATTQAGERVYLSNIIKYPSYDHLPVGTKGSFSKTGSGYGYERRGGRKGYRRRSKKRCAKRRGGLKKKSLKKKRRKKKSCSKRSRRAAKRKKRKGCRRRRR